MRIICYDREYSRRHFLKQVARGTVAAGVLMPMWDAMADNGDAGKAYPENLRSIEGYTKGKIKTGDEISAGNVEYVKELLSPIQYYQISEMGRRLCVAPTTTDIMKLSPWEYMEATLRNKGKARFNATGDVVVADGKPWIGGNPFPDAQTALKLFAGLTMSWGRHDASFYAIKGYDVSVHGEVQFQHDLGWAEMSPVARTVMLPKPYWPGHENQLRFQSVFFVTPDEVKGTSFLNIWPYDQHKFPALYGYLPAFQRIRQFPTNQRFEPLIPGSTLYLSDAWAAGDPLYTWGNYRIVGRGPFLAAVAHGWDPDHPNWEHETHVGPYGKTFWNTTVELVPEAIVTEAEPVMFPRAPLSKKRVWFDARTGLPISMVTYDRRKKPFHSFDGAYGVYEKDGKSFMNGSHPYWSWCQVHAYDIQSGRMTRLEQVKQISGGYRTAVNDASMYDKYLTKTALMRLGGTA